jgi:hypothetical protein
MLYMYYAENAITFVKITRSLVRSLLHCSVVIVISIVSIVQSALH